MSDIAISFYETTIGTRSGPLLTDLGILLDSFLPRRRPLPVKSTPSAAASIEVREIDSGFQQLDADVQELDQHLRGYQVDAEDSGELVADGINHDVALRMPRTVVRTFKARLKPVETTRLVRGPSAQEWEAIEAASTHDRR